MNLRIATFALCIATLHAFAADKDKAPAKAGNPPASADGKTVNLAMMTWYHPLLEPSLYPVTLLCTVVDTKPNERYGSSYWSVRLRIDEQIYVAPGFQKYVAGAKYLISGDFHKRKPGERILLFGGLDEKYEGEDFLIPCLEGTTSNLGIVLPPLPKKTGPDDDTEDFGADLLAQLRKAALPADAGFIIPWFYFYPYELTPKVLACYKENDIPQMPSDLLSAFANICPEIVARALIRDVRHKELLEDIKKGNDAASQ